MEYTKWAEHEFYQNLDSHIKLDVIPLAGLRLANKALKVFFFFNYYTYFIENTGICREFLYSLTLGFETS
jgi:hypothetical protein